MKRPSRKFTKSGIWMFLQEVIAPALAMFFIVFGLIYSSVTPDRPTRTRDTRAQEVAEETVEAEEELVVEEEVTEEVPAEEEVVEEVTEEVTEEEVPAEEEITEGEITEEEVPDEEEITEGEVTEETPEVALDGEGDEIVEEEVPAEEEVVEEVTEEVTEETPAEEAEEEVPAEEETTEGEVTEEETPAEEVEGGGGGTEVTEETPTEEGTGEEVIPEEETPAEEETSEIAQDGEGDALEEAEVQEEILEVNILDDDKTLIEGQIIREKPAETEIPEVAKIKLAEVSIKGKKQGDEITYDETAEALISLTTTQENIEEVLIKTILKEYGKGIADLVLEDQELQTQISERVTTGIFESLGDRVAETLSKQELKDQLAKQLEDDPDIEDILTLMVTDDLKDKLIKRLNKTAGPKVDLEDEVAELIKNDYNKFNLEALVGEKITVDQGAQDILLNNIVEVAAQPQSEVLLVQEAPSVINVVARGPSGTIEIPLENLRFEAGSVIMVVEPLRKMTPGLYQAEITINNPITGKTETIIQDLAWGVLAMNTDQDQYELEQQGIISMGVLDDRGRPVCDAEVTLEVVTPDGSTRTPAVENTGTCQILDSLNVEPDYVANYTFAQTGEYTLRLTATLSNGTSRTMTSKVGVQKKPDFIIKRTAATRLYPVGVAPMSIDIYFNKNFSGSISEIMPADFIVSEIQSTGTAISDTGVESLSEDGEARIITWQVEATAGNTQSFRYFYDAPDISPEFYTIGPIYSSGNLLEKRQWQIANDEPYISGDDSDLIGHWEFNTGSGTTAYDSTTLGDDLTLTNMDAGNWDTNVPTTANENPYSLSFDGSSEYATVPDTNDLDLSNIADVTITGWIDRDLDTNYNPDTIVAKRNGDTSSDTGYIVFLEEDLNNNYLVFEVSDGTDEYSMTSSTQIDSAGWVHFAVVWDQDSAANSKIYINGSDDSETHSGTIGNIDDLSNTLDFRIGAESDGGEPFFGNIDDIRLYNRALTSEEVTILAGGNAPGGVRSNLEVWLKADDGVTNSGGVADDGEDAETWTDQSGNNYVFDHNTTPAIGGTYPAWNDNLINFNPALSFDGGADRLGRSSFSTWPQTEHLIVTVLQRDDHGGTEWVWTYGVSADDDQSYVAQEGDGSYVASFGGNNYYSPVPSPPNDDGNPHIFAIYRTGTTIYHVSDGTGLGSEAHTQTGTQDGCFVFAEEADGLCTGFSTAQHFYGDIPEFIVYDGAVSTSDQKKIYSYLALKYGVTLDQSEVSTNGNDGTGDYVDSSGSTIWDAHNGTSQNAFRYHITGIGKDDASKLNQPKSKNPDSEAIVQISDPTSLGNQDFLVWGHDNGERTWVSTSSNSSLTAPSGYKILDRVWQVQETNDLGTVDIEIDVENPEWLVPTLLNGSGFYLVRDSDNDGSLSDETPLAMYDNGVGGGDDTASDGKWTAQVDFNSTGGTADGKIEFALATINGTQSYPGNVSSNLRLWLKADAGVTNSGGTADDGEDAETWTDSGSYTYALDHTAINYSGKTYPAWNDNRINGHPVVSFDGDYDALGIGDFYDWPEDEHYIVTVYQDSNASTRDWMWAYGISTDDDLSYMSIETDGSFYSNFAGNIFYPAVPPLAGNDGNPHIITTERDGTRLAHIFDGYEVGYETNNTTNTKGGCFMFGQEPDGLCNGFQNSQDFEGDIAEFIIYDGFPSATDEQKLNSYLSIKYGISLDQTTNFDYLDGAGTTIWSSDNTYEYTIAGIGQDNDWGLTQTASESNNWGDVVRISEPSAMADGEFLIWAGNNGENLWTTTGAPSGYQILERQWQTYETGDVGTVDIQFNTRSPQFMLPAILSGSSYYFVYDSDNDGVLSDETPVAMTDDGTGGDDTSSDGKWTTQLNFDGSVGAADGRIEFTIATLTGTKYAPAGVTSDLRLWLRADSSNVSQSGDNTAATDWTSSDPYQYFFDRTISGAGGVDPKWHSSQINNNPTLSFYETTDRLALTDFYDMPTGDFWIATVYQRQDANDEWIWSYGSNNTSQRLNTNGYFLSYYGGTFIQNTGINTGDNGYPHIITMRRTGSTFTQVLDGEQIQSGSNTNSAPLGSCLYIGEWTNVACTPYSTSYDFVGDLAEMIIYGAYPSSLNEQKVNSYLALRYGITLDQSAASGGTDYRDGSGTIIWAQDTSDIFENDIAGIGRGTITANYNQTDSTASTDDAIVRIYGASSQGYADYLMWANDNGDRIWTTSTSNSSIAAPSGYQILDRVWQIQETNEIGTVEIEIDTRQPMWRVPAILSGSSYYFVYDSDNDGVLSDETPVAMTDDGTGGDETSGDDKWTAQINFDDTIGAADGRVEFTLATPTGTQYYPADYSTDLRLWLRADSSNVSQSGDNTAATDWTSSDPYQYFFDRTISGAGGVDPKWHSSQINNNPTLSFYETTDRLALTDFYEMPTGDFWIASVYQRENANDEWIWSYGSNNTSQRLHTNGYFLSYYNGSYIQNTGTNSADDGYPHITTMRRTGSTFTHQLDGKQLQTGSSTTSAPSGSCIYLGEWTNTSCVAYGTSYDFEGDLAEMIIYANYPSDTVQLELNSYLALKYGITLSDDTDGDSTTREAIGSFQEGDYVASDGSTTIFDISANGSHVNDVAGIGRDDAVNFSQTQSQASTSDSVLIVSSPSGMDDLEFISWANDDGSLSSASSELPASGLPTLATSRLTREWEMQNRGIDTVTVSFDLNNQTALSSEASSSDYALLLDSDGNFSTVSTIHTTGASISDGVVSFTGVTITNGYYVTLAGPEPPAPGNFAVNMELWLRADSGTSTTVDDATVSTWYDSSTSANDGTATNTPAYQSDTDNLINGYPVVEFVSNDYFTLVNSTLDVETTMMFAVGAPSANSLYRSLYKGAAEDSMLIIDSGADDVGYFDTGSGDFEDSGSSWEEDEVALFRVYIGTDQASFYKNGSSTAASTAATLDLAGAQYDYVGTNQSSQGFGRLAETIIYNYSDGLTAVPIQRIESYLALKYGVSLDQTSAKDYFATDCYDSTCSTGTIMWDASAAGSYKYDVAGIGQDSLSGLLQTESKSSSFDGILRISEATDQGNKEFLVWSNNDGTATWTETGAPGSYKIISRQWQVQEVGDVGTVDIEFDMSDLDFYIPGTTDNNYYFVYDADNDGDLSDETPVLMKDDGTGGDDTSSDNKWTTQLNFDGTGGTQADGIVDFGIVGNVASVDTASLTGSDTFDDLLLSFTTTPSSQRGIVNWKKDGSSITQINMPFEGVGGIESSVAKDYSENNNNATVNSATWSSTGGYNSTGGYSFAGGNYYLQTSSNVGLSNGATPVTICTWVKPSTVSGNYWLAQMGPSTSNSSYSIFQSNGKLVFDTWNNQLGTSDNVLTADTWTHFCAVYESGNFNTSDLYVDGIERTSSFIYGTGSAAPTYVDGPLRLGYRLDNSYPYAGSLDEFMVFNRALTPEQIKAIYEAGVDFDTLASDETAVGDGWEACVTVNTNGDDGTTKCTGETTITDAVTSPGNIYNNLELWFKADAGVTNTGNGTDATAWTDQSGTPVTLDHNTTPSIGGTYPTYYTGRINGYPAIYFEGDGDANNVGDVLGADSMVSSPEEDLYIAYVYSNFSASAAGDSLYSYATGTSDRGNEILLPPRNDGTVETYLRNTNVTSSDVGSADGKPHIFVSRRSGSSVTQLFDGASAGSATVSTVLETGGCLVFGADQDGICSDFAAEEYYQGDLAEVIVYADDLTDYESQKVNSYLGLKYGITIDQANGTTGTDYFASDCVDATCSTGTIMWDASDSIDISANDSGNIDNTDTDDYVYDLAGIGRDDDSGLNQTSASSENNDSIITISSPSDLGDLEFMVWGNNNQTGSSTNIPPSGVPANADSRFTRVWRVQQAGSVGTVSVAFDLTGVGSITNTGVAGDYALLIDADGDFSSGATIHTTGASFNSDVISFTGATIADGSYISLAGPAPPRPGGYGANMELWFKADAGVTNSGNATDATAWLDQGDFGVTVDHTNSTIASGGTYPTYYSSLINGNPGLTFDDTTDRLGVDSLTHIPTGDLFVTGVYRRDDYTGTYNENIFSYSTGTTPSDNEILLEPRGDGTLTSLLHNVGLISSDVGTDDSIPHIAGVRRTGTTHTNVFDGSQVASGTSSDTLSTGGCLIFGEEQDALCGSFDTNGAWEGDLAEIVAYSEYPSDAVQQQINSYLALKYGITLSDDTDGDSTTREAIGSHQEGDYIASDGTTYMLDISAHGTYVNDIAGIGQDDDSGLNQTSSSSVNSDSILTISNASDQDNLEFLVWGNDNGSLTTASTEIPSSGMPTNATVRLTREWYLRHNGGDNGTVTVAFDLNGQTALDKAASASDYALLIDYSDGDFSAVNTIHTTGASVSNGVVSFTGVDLTYMLVESPPWQAYITLAGPLPPGPGGVATDLNLWFKADAGVTNTGGAADNGEDAEAWEDQTSGITLDHNTSTAIGGTYPTFYTNRMNYNPALDFDDTTDRLGVDSLTLMPTTDMFMASVYSRSTLSPDGSEALYGYGPSNDLLYFFNNNDTISSYISSSQASSTVDWDDSNPHISVVRRTGSTHTQLFDGAQVMSGSNSTTVTTGYCLVLGEESDSDCGGFDNAQAWEGDYAEFVIYDAYPSATDQQKILSYLALKYGITLDQSGATTNDGTGDYIDSDGNVIWDAHDGTSQVTHRYDIAGIGRDDISGLSQTQSRSENDDSVLDISNASDLEDQEFLVWANNDGSVSGTSIDRPTPGTGGMPSNATVRTARQWYVRNTGGDGVGSVTIAFDLDSLPGIKNSGSAADYALLIDSDYATDSVFSDATVHTTGASFNSNEITFTTASISDGDYIALAGPPPPSPGGVSGPLIWLKAGAGITGSSPVTAWADQSISGNDATYVGDPQLTTNGLNYNDTITFDGAGDYFDTSLSINESSYADLSVVSVYIPNTADYGCVWGEDNGGWDRFYGDISVCDEGISNGTGCSANITNAFASGVPTISTAILDEDTTDGSFVYINGKNQLTFTSNYGPEGSSSLNVGDIGNGTADFNGDIAEIAIFNDLLASSVSRQRIESYLALKYGITLDQTTATDYLASDCPDATCATGTIMWDASAAAGYDNDVAGIGRDDNSELNQTTSSSVNSDSMLTISNASDLENLEFMVWGNDNGSLSVASTEIPSSGMPANANVRLTREWLVRQSGYGTSDGVGTVTVAFDLSQQSIFDSNAPASDYALLINFTSGDFSTVNTVHTTGASISNGVISFTGVNLKYFLLDSDPYPAYITLAGPLATGPGGVYSNLGLWLKADAGVYTDTGCSSAASDTDDIACWADQSTNALEALQSSATYQPNYVASDLNYNPSILFNANYLQITGGVFGTSTYTDANVYAVKSTVTNNNNTLLRENLTPAFFNIYTPWSSTVYWDAGTSSGDYRLSTAWGGSLNVPYIWTYNYSTTSTADGNNQDISRDGLNIANDATASSFTGLGNSMYIGGYAATYPDNAYYGEVIIYGGGITATQNQKIESYLALKYGITIDQTSDIDYLDSAGNIIWDASAAGSYDNDIAGIGQDDNSELDQTQSKSANSDGILRVADASSQDSGDFLVWANNNGAATWTSTGAPTGYKLLTRQWEAQEDHTSHDIGTVDLEFDIADADFDVPALETGSNYYFVYDSDNDGSLSDETPTAMNDSGTSGDDTSSDNKWTAQLDFNGSGGTQTDDIIDFTIATEELVLPPTVSDAYISISGGTGTSGAYIVGDTVVVVWNNSASGDNNSGLTSVTADLSEFGGGSSITMEDDGSGGTCDDTSASDEIYCAAFTLVSGAIDDTNNNAHVTATNSGGPTTGDDTTNATVDNIPPVISANGTLTITVDNGVADVAAVNNGFDNQDKVTQSAVTLSGPDGDTTTIDLTSLTGEATLSAGTQSSVVTPGSLDNATQTFTITVTDNAGNTATTASDAISVDNELATVSTSAISVTGASGGSGEFVTGDTATGRWDDSATGDNNTDTISSVSFNLSDWISTATSVAGSNSSDIWTTAAQSPLDSQYATNNNTTVTVTDNGGNITTTIGTNNYTIDTSAIVDTVVITGEDETDDLALSYNITPSGAKAVVDWTVDETSIALLNMPFEANGGSESTITYDYSSHSYNGTVNNASWSSSSGADGHGAYTYSNSSDYISLGDSFLDGLTEASFSVWVYHNTIADDDDIISVGDHTSNSPFVFWRDESTTDHYAFLLNDGVDYSGVLYSSAVPSQSSWTHLVLTFVGGDEVRLYINGTEDANSPFSITSIDSIESTTSPIYIGNDGLSDKDFDGIIDELLIFDQVLTADQVTDLYNSGTPEYENIDHGITNAGETWQACVTPNNGSSDGTEVCSNTTQIKPTVDSNTLPAAHEMQNLISTYTTTPSDAKAIFDWKKDQSSFAELNMPFEANNGSESTTSYDYSDNSHDATVSGATFLSSGGVDGHGAYSFDGTDDYMNLGDVDFITNSEFTLSVWLYNQATKQAFILGDEQVGNGGVILQTDSSGYIQTYRSGYYTSSYQLPLNEWHQIVYRQTSSGLELIVDGGDYSETLTTNTHINTNYPFYLGAFQGTTREYNGDMDELMIFSTALSDEQISALYNNGTPDHSKIVYQETTTGDDWQACITPNAGGLDGDEVCSADRTITAAPSINTISFTGDTADDDLVLSYTTTPVGLNGIVDWRIDNSSMTVLNMPFEANNGDEDTQAKDYSTYGNDATVSGATWSSTADANGNGAYEFNGSSDYMTLGTSSSMQPSDITVSFWVRRESSWQNINNLVMWTKNSNWNANGWYIGTEDASNSNQAVTMMVDGGNGFYVSADPDTFFPINTWTHVVATFDSDTNTYAVYKNGASQTVTNYGSPDSITGTSDTKYVGKTPGDASYFDGKLDELVIFDRVLSADQISNLYNSGSPDYGTIDSLETDYGENWEVCVTPNDGTADGVQSCTDKTFPPEVDTVTLAPASVDEDLSLSYNLSPSNARAVVDWKKNQSSIAILNMPFEANGGSESSTTKDYSDTGNDGTVSSATWSSTGGVDSHGAYSFAGTGDYVRSGSNTGISGTADRTVCLWVKPAQTYSSSCCATPWAMGANSSGQAFGTFANNGYWYFFRYLSDISTGVAITTGWEHHCIAYNGTNVIYYINGTEAINQASSLNTAASPIYFGLDTAQRSSTYFNGLVDDAQIFDFVLSPEQVSALYNSGTLDYDTIAAEETNAGEDWQACVTPNYTIDGTEVCSNEITIKPAVTDPNISISGGTGTGGAYIVDDTITVTWDNSSSGDNNTGTITSVTADLSGWGGSSTATMTDTTACGGTLGDDIYEACYTLVSGSIDTTNVNATVTASNAGGSTGPVSDTTNATVDTELPTISASNISVTGATGAGGVFISGDTATGTWDNSVATGDGNTDISSVSFNLSNFVSGDTARSGSNTSDVWTADTSTTVDAVDDTNNNTTVTATDDAGNQTTVQGENNYTVSAAGPVGTSITPSSTRIIDNSYPSFTVSDGTDSDGIDTGTRVLERQEATYASNTCGSYGSWGTVTYSGTYPSISDNTATGSKCYKYRWSVDDTLGNTTTSSESSEIVRVPLTTIVITAGNNQSYGDSANNPIGYTLPTALQVQVTDGGTNWALTDEVTVDFAFNTVPGTPTATGQSLGSANDNTDASGNASTTLTFGDRAGDYTVDATSTHSSITVEPTFTATAGQHFSLVVTEANMSINLSPTGTTQDKASPTVTVTTNAASYSVALTPNQWPLSAALDEILNWAGGLGFGWDLNAGSVTAYSENTGNPAQTTVYSCSGDSCQGANVIDINIDAAIDTSYTAGAYSNTVNFSGQSISY